MDFAISTRTPLQAILTSLQTSYRLLSRRGSQTVSVEQAQSFPSILRDIHGLLKRTTQNGKMLLHRSTAPRNNQLEVARQTSTSNLQDVANELQSPQLPSARGQGALFIDSRALSTEVVLPARCQTFLAECSCHSRSSPRKTQHQKPRTPGASDRDCSPGGRGGDHGTPW